MSKGSSVYKHIMTGVSHFLPFVCAGGILLSLAFLFDAGNAGTATFGSSNPVSKWLLEVGGVGFGLMIPVLAGYVSYSISDRPGLVSGMVAGMLASNAGTGFIGALIGGFVAGYITLFLKKNTAKLPRTFESAKTILIFPIFGVLLTSLAMIAVNFVVNPINTYLTGWLENLSGVSSILLGALIGGMLAVDMGGPINKTAYLFSVASLTAADGSIVPSVAMAAAACSGMTISTSCALATTLFPKRFDESLKQAGKAAYILGLSYIAEGAIPFVIAKPKVVLPSIIVGAAVAGGLSAALGLTITAPVGGVFTMPLTSNILLYILAFIIGTLVSTFMIGFLSKVTEKKETENTLD